MINVTLAFLSFLVYILLRLNVYEKYTGIKCKKNIRIILLLLSYVIFYFVLYIFSIYSVKLIILWLLTIFMQIKWNKSNFKQSYFFSIIAEILLLTLIIPLTYVLHDLFLLITADYYLIMANITLIIVLLLYLLYSSKFFYVIYNTIKKYYFNSNVYYVITSLIIIVLALFHELSSNITYNFLFIEIIFILLFLVIAICVYYCISIKKNYISIKKHENMINDYKNTINDYKVLKHNLLNNLLAIKLANNEEKNQFLDELMNNYNLITNNDMKYYSNNLGLIGMIETKLNEATVLGIHTELDIQNINLNISKKNYLDIAQSLGIIMDNAIEASLNSINKVIYISINKKEIKIINSFNNELDIDKLLNEKYSTKNRGSGFGLNWINNSNIKININIVDDLFITNIIV